MEYYQNNTIIEQPERAPVSTGLQVAAMVLGIIGVIAGYICYMFVYCGLYQFRNAVSIGFSAVSDGSASLSGNSVVIVFIGIAIALCTFAIILGAIGLVRSIRRPRTVKGIVFSAVGLSNGIVGMIFALMCIFVSGFLSTMMDVASKM